MTKYIKGKDGKFAGSIGDGKTNVPTPSNLPTVAAPAQQPASAASVTEAYAKFTAKKNPYKFAAWAVEPDYKWFRPERASDWEDNWIMTKDTEYDEDDRGSQWARDYITGIMKTEPIEGSRWVENGRIHEYHRIHGIDDVGNDDHVMAIWHSTAEDGSDAKNVLGFLTPNGKFYSNDEDPDDTLRLSIAYSSSLREHCGETLEEIKWNLVADEKGVPIAFEVEAQSDSYQPVWDDPNDEYDPDRYL